MLSLAAAAARLNAAGVNAAHCGADVVFTGVGNDSRRIEAGMLYVAIVGERCDGHAFVDAALQRGAAAALVSRGWLATQDYPTPPPLLVVDDCRLALAQLAASWRADFSLPLIGVTGSNGKTTVKEMCAAILAARYDATAVLATAGNYNNDIGLPLTLLRLRRQHKAAVIEMGMNHAGEIDVLTRLARPTAALINNAQRAHLAGLGSLAAVARAKGEILAGLDADGVAVLNADDPHYPLWRRLAGERRVISFALDAAEADIRARWRPLDDGGELTLLDGDEAHSIHLKAPGAHNARNAVAAAAACSAVGAPLATAAHALAAWDGVNGRLQRRPGINGAVVIDDSYNANPDSMRAAIDVLAALPGLRILVIGDMAEVGEAAAQMHEEIGGYAKSQGVDQLLATGDKSIAAVRNFSDGARHFASPAKLATALRSMLTPQCVVLVKGSRFMRMEQVVAAITPAAATSAPLAETPHAA